MNHQESYSPEIQSRIDSSEWGEKIAQNVSIKYGRIQFRNRIILSTLGIFLLSLFSFFGFFVESEFLNPTLTELDTIRLLLSDDFFSLYESVYQEDSLSSLIDPISFFR